MITKISILQTVYVPASDNRGLISIFVLQFLGNLLAARRSRKRV